MYSSFGVVQPFDSSCNLVSSPLYTPRILAIQRLVLSIYGYATIIFSLLYESIALHEGNIWFSYFTHLTLAGLTAHLTVSAYHGFRCKSSPSSVYSYPLQGWHEILKASHLCNISAVTTFPLLVTITYWTLIASPDTFSSTYNTWAAISKHIFNAILALSEITTTNIPPLPWKTLPVCLIILCAYLGLAYITHATEGVYVYAFLDPGVQHWKLAIYIIGIAIGEIVIFVLVRYMMVLRDKISGRSSTDGLGVPYWPQNGRIGDWEAVPMSDAELSENIHVRSWSR